MRAYSIANGKINDLRDQENRLIIAETLDQVSEQNALENLIQKQKIILRNQGIKLTYGNNLIERSTDDSLESKTKIC